MANHGWHDARRIAHRRSGGRCVICGAPSQEVDHIISRNGMGYGLGCHHHQDALQPLCHDDHVAIGVARRGGCTAKKAPLREQAAAAARKLQIAAGQQKMAITDGHTVKA